MNRQRLGLSVRMAIIVAIAFTLTTHIAALGQPMLGGLVTSTYVGLYAGQGGQQYFIDGNGQKIYLPGNGVAASQTQIFTGPAGNRWYVDRTGVRVDIPAQAQVQSGTPSTSESGSGSVLLRPTATRGQRHKEQYG